MYQGFLRERWKSIFFFLTVFCFWLSGLMFGKNASKRPTNRRKKTQFLAFFQLVFKKFRGFLNGDLFHRLRGSFHNDLRSDGGIFLRFSLFQLHFYRSFRWRFTACFQSRFYGVVSTAFS